MSKQGTDIVSYITIVGWIIAYCCGTKEESKFHLNQSLVLFLSAVVLSLVGKIPIVGIAAWILNIVVGVFWIMGLVYAIQGVEREVPVLGSIKILS